MYTAAAPQEARSRRGPPETTQLLRSSPLEGWEHWVPQAQDRVFWGEAGHFAVEQLSNNCSKTRDPDNVRQNIDELGQSLTALRQQRCQRTSTKSRVRHLSLDWRFCLTDPRPAGILNQLPLYNSRTQLREHVNNNTCSSIGQVMLSKKRSGASGGSS